MFGKMTQKRAKLDGFVNISEILQGGVYALVYHGEVIYVGKAKKMLNRLTAHLSLYAAKRKRPVPDWLSIQGIYYDEVWVRPCHPDRVDALEREMIALYRPRKNIYLVPSGPITAPFSIRVGNVVLPFNTQRPPAHSGLPEITRRI